MEYRFRVGLEPLEALPTYDAGAQLVADIVPPVQYEHVAARLGQAQRRHIARGTCSRHDHVMHTRVLRLGRTYFEVLGPLIVPRLPALADSLPRGILTCAGARTTLDPAPSGAVPNALTLRGRAPTLLRA